MGKQSRIGSNSIDIRSQILEPVLEEQKNGLNESRGDDQNAPNVVLEQ
jgi:hypothetical protein